MDMYNMLFLNFQSYTLRKMMGEILHKKSVSEAYFGKNAKKISCFNMTLGRKVTRKKKVQKKWEKIVQWSPQKRVLGEGVQFSLKDFPYIVGFVR